MEPNSQPQASTSANSNQMPKGSARRGAKAKSTSRKASDKLKAKALHKTARAEDRFSASRQKALEKQFSRAERQLKASTNQSQPALSPQQSPVRGSQINLSPPQPANSVPEATFTPTAAGLRDPAPQQEFMAGFQLMLERTLSQGFAGLQQSIQSMMVPQQQTPYDDCLSVTNSLALQQRDESVIHEKPAESEVSYPEDDTRDQTLSGDEETVPDPPAFASLFPTEIFKSLLDKAKITSELGEAPSTQQAGNAPTKNAQSLFSTPTPPANLIPTSQIVMDVIKKQWQKPGTQLLPNSLDKKYYQGDQEMSNLLQLPKVDDPIINVVSPSLTPGDAAEILKPEERKLELALRAAFQASAWAIRSASAVTFFNRATLLWLQQMEARLPSADNRLQQDLNKIKAAIQFSADATLDSVRFASRSLASSIASRRLLWLRGWQADTRAKWRIASGAFQGEKLFGETIDPLLIETKDKKKILPTQRKKSDRKFQPYNRRPVQRADFQQDQTPRPYFKRPERPQDRYRDRYRPQNQSKRPFRGAGGRPFRKSR